MAFWKKFLIVFAVFSLIGTPLFVHFFSKETYTVYPTPTEYFFINDYAGVFSQEAEEYIYAQAVALEQATGAQLVVVSVPDTQEDTIEHYSISLANKWGIGQKDADNGLLILFTTEEPHVRMEVGRGLEGQINDAKAGRLLDDYAVDAKDNGRWDEAAVNTFSATAMLIYEEYGVTPPDTLTVGFTESKTDRTSTMADKRFPAVGEKENEKPLFQQILTAFGIFWAIALLPFFFIMSLMSGGRRKGRAGSAGQRFDNFLINMIDTVLELVRTCICCLLDCSSCGGGGGGSGGGGGGHSGGGGSFGGGGATR